MAQRCTLCNLDFKNDDQIKQHLEGKRHKKLESMKEERERSAKRSLFVSGLRKNTFIKQIEDHFIQFGKIIKIVSDQEKNAFAIVEYENDESVDNALKFKGEHKVFDKNLKVSRRQMKEFVSRIQNHAERKKEILDKLNEEALAVNTILGKCESFDDQIDKLIDYLRLDKESLDKRRQVSQELTEIFGQFWSTREFEVQIFGSTENDLACKGSDMDLTLLIKDYLTENRVKQQKTPKIVVKQLKQSNEANSNKSEGMQSNNDSDSNMASEAIETEMDENVDLDHEDSEEKNDLTLKESVAKFFNDKEYKLFIKFDVEHQIKISARIIQRFLKDLKSLKTIINTRCPVVNFYHEKANVNCDLSLNNFLAAENTKLIKLYLELEPSLKKLIFVLRYWFKHKNLYSSSRFNSYTIIWLVIFYMQTKKIGYLPTVNELSILTGKVNQIHGWSCAFEDDLEKLKSLKAQNTQINKEINVNCMNDLLKGFFEFYSNFKFSSDSNKNIIICTRTGQLIETTENSHLSKISPYINVQDPFDLSHNLSGNVSKSTVERFVAECNGSNEILTYSSQPRKSSTKCWGLILLMTKKAMPVLSPTSKMTKELVEKSLLQLKLSDETENGNNFNTQNAIDFVMFLLKECLLFEQLEGDKMIVKAKKRIRVLNQICDRVDSIELKNSPKRLKVGGDSSKNAFVCVFDENNNGKSNNGESDNEENKSSGKRIASYQFNIKYNTWQGRRAIKREIQKQLNEQEKKDDLVLEKLTSQKLITQNSNGQKGINFKIDFLNQTDNKTEIGDKAFQSFSNLKIKFDLLDEVQTQNELIEFTTLVHFIDIYINNCKDKLFNQWIASKYYQPIILEPQN